MEKINLCAIICYGDPFDEMRGNIIAFDPYDKETLIKKMGMENFLEKYISGELYPSI